VSNHEDQLREAFVSHENLAPDPAAVYARVQELSKTYTWRRRGIQAAGGVVVGAGLIAGIVNMTAVLPHDPDKRPAAVLPAAPPSVSASPSLSAVDEQRAYDAYFQAGYDYEDAQQLAKMWQMSDIGQVKATAGGRLLRGLPLPFAATPDDPASEEPVDPKIQARYQAFFDAGYVWDDAVKLAKLWKLSDPSDAKIEGGKRLLDGKKLPVRPKAANVADALENKRVDAFFRAGYTVDDAVKLAELWHQKDAYGAKIEGGKRLLAGQSLPIKP
jgi:hypothetical protein